MKETKKKLLYLIPTLNVAGAEKVVIDLSNNINSEKFEVYILTLRDEVPLAAILKPDQNVRLFNCGLKRTKFPWISLRVLNKFIKLIRQIQPDLIHSHFWGIHCFYLLGIKKLKNRSFFSTIHTAGLHYTSKGIVNTLFRGMEIFIYKKYDYKIISISDQVDHLCKNILNLTSVYLIYNGIDTENYRPRKLDSTDVHRNHIKTLISVGRFSEEKGHIFALQALNILVNRLGKKNLRLQFIGREIEENLSSLVNQFNLSGYVEFLGVRMDIPTLLTKAEIGVFPSTFEGFGLSCGEMMSSELPCVVSDIPPLREITKQGQGAILVKAGDSEALAQEILRLENDPLTAKMLGQKARKIIEEHFSLKQQVVQHEKLYLKANR